MDHESTVTRYTALDVSAIINGVQVLLDDGRYRVVSLNSAPAAAWWGSGTRWCTTDPAWFQTYEKHGELICIEDRRDARRWQFQFWRCELRNWRNRRADPLVFARKNRAVMDALQSRIVRDFRARFFFGLVGECERVEHGLNLQGVRLRSLPDGLHVRDDLDVSDTDLKTLPSGLRVGGHMFISERPSLIIPADAKIRGTVFVRSKRLLPLSDTIGEFQSVRSRHEVNS